jgi:hypothetical protein
MPEDRSLDEFAVGPEAGGEQDDADETVDGGDDAVDGGDDAVDSAEPTDGEEDAAQTADAEAIDADPAVSTATWTTDGAACDRCGERVARRWFADGDLVCAACKEW